MWGFRFTDGLKVFSCLNKFDSGTNRVAVKTTLIAAGELTSTLANLPIKVSKFLKFFKSNQIHQFIFCKTTKPVHLWTYDESIETKINKLVLLGIYC